MSRTAAPLVVGISGPTRAGKGVLVRELLKYLTPKSAREEKEQHQDPKDVLRGVLRLNFGGYQISVINQDWYFMEDKIKNEMEGYESPQAIDFDAMYTALQMERAVSGMQYVFLEGFLIFHDDRVMRLLDRRIWLDVPRGIILKRRRSSKYCTTEYFSETLWPAHEAYADRVFSFERQQAFPVERIDGTETIRIVFKTFVTMLDLEPRAGGMDQRDATLAPKKAAPLVARAPPSYGPRISGLPRAAPKAVVLAATAAATPAALALPKKILVVLGNPLVTERDIHLKYPGVYYLKATQRNDYPWWQKDSDTCIYYTWNCWRIAAKGVCSDGRGHGLIPTSDMFANQEERPMLQALEVSTPASSFGPVREKPDAATVQDSPYQKWVDADDY